MLRIWEVKMKIVNVLFGLLLTLVLVLAGCGGGSKSNKNDLTGPSGLDPNATAMPMGNDSSRSTDIPNGTSNGIGPKLVVDEFTPTNAITELAGEIKLAFHVENDFDPGSLRFKVNNQFVDLRSSSITYQGDPASKATILIKAQPEVLRRLSFYNKHDNEMKLEVQNATGEKDQAMKYLHFALNNPSLLAVAEETDCECGKPCIQFFTFSSSQGDIEAAVNYSTLGGIQKWDLTQEDAANARDNGETTAFFSLTAGVTDLTVKRNLVAAEMTKRGLVDEGDFSEIYRLNLGAEREAFTIADQGDCEDGEVEVTFTMKVEEIIYDEDFQPLNEVTDAACVEITNYFQ